MKIQFKAPLNTPVEKNFEINFVDMDSKEFDQLRVFLQYIFKYGQFKDSDELAKDLSLDKLIKQSFKKD